MNSPGSNAVQWSHTAAVWLTPRRLRAHALLLAIILWGVCAVDFSKPGVLDRAGNLKFQDFLPLYSAAQMMARGDGAAVYDQSAHHQAMESAIQQPVRATLPYLYGPPVAWMLMPLARLPFQFAAIIYVTVSLVIFAACVYALWRACPHLASSPGLVAIIALAYPPLFHFFVRGQNSAFVLAFFTVAYFAFRRSHDLLAGLVLGCLVLKPQFLVAIPFVLLLSTSWAALAGVIASAALQLVFVRFYFGQEVWGAYVDTLTHMSRWLRSAEVSLAPTQMHSLRSFWDLLIPFSQNASFALYLISAVSTIAIAAFIWKSSETLTVRFSALALCAVLVNPHLFIYDLLALVPALLLLADWALEQWNHPPARLLSFFMYLSVLLPLFGAITRWTHMQLSVPVFVLLLWTLKRITIDAPLQCRTS